MKIAGRFWDDPNFQGIASGAKATGSVVTEGLTPKVILQDADGRPLTQHETVAGPGTESKVVETIPWRVWAVTACAVDDAQVAKHVLGLAMAANHEHMTRDIPIALTRQGNAIKALATRDIPIGGLKVPLWFRKDASMVMGDGHTAIHPKVVRAEVSRVKPVTPVEKEAGVGSGHRSLTRLPPSILTFLL